MLLSSPKARLITFFQDSFNKILSRQLTLYRSYVSELHDESISLLTESGLCVKIFKTKYLRFGEIIPLFFNR